MGVADAFPSPSSSEAMTFTEDADDCTVVWLYGEHDFTTANALTAVLTTAASREHVDVVVDLSAVSYMSAATIGVIIRTRTCLQRRSSQLTLRSPSQIARRLLDLCHLTYIDGAELGPGHARTPSMLNPTLPGCDPHLFAHHN